MSTIAPPAPPGADANSPAKAKPTVSVPDALKAGHAIYAEVTTENVESEALAKLMILAVIARGHSFVVGTKGCGKSQITDGLLRRLPGAPGGGRYFKTQCKREQELDDFFGPLALSQLANDLRVHAIDGYLPTVYFAYLDEFCDMPVSAQRALLMLMEEREYQHGSAIRNAPLMSLKGTTNFWRDDPESEALMDRFLFRFVKEAVKSDAGRMAILDGQLDRIAGGGFTGPQTHMTIDQLLALQHAATQVKVPKAIRKAVVKLQADLERDGIDTTTRRAGAGMRLAMANAVWRGGDTVTLPDLVVYGDVFPNTPDEMTKVQERCAAFAGAQAKEAREVKALFTPLAKDLDTLRQEKDTGTGTRATLVPKFVNLLGSIEDVGKIADKKIADAQANGHDATELESVKRDITGAMDYITKSMFDWK